MATSGSSQLAALCAVCSFLWLSSSVQHHPLIDRPRLSSALVLLISGLVSYLASFASLLLPGANGRFDGELPTAKDKNPQTNLPKRPRRYFLPAVVVAVVFRLELFRIASDDLQCAAPGVELFLPFLLAIYEVLPGRRPRAEWRKGDDEIFSQNAFEDFEDFAETSAPLSLLSGLLLSFGAYRAVAGNYHSTYFCSAFDSATRVFWAQLGGLLLDAVIIVLLWRILAWAKTTKHRLRTLSGILLASSLALGTMVWLLQQFETHDGLGSLYAFDVIFDASVFSLFIISSTFVVCEGTPSALAGTMVLISGLLSVSHNIALVGTWENVRRGQSQLALFILCVGFAVFSYTTGSRSILYIRRIVVLVLLGLFFVSFTLFIIFRGSLLDDHPLDKLTYNNRIEADRWLIKASVSKSLKIAVQEYQERNHRRDPPPKFDVWYKYATDRASPIMDHFEQIGHDILPFWGLSPEKLREGVALAAQQPDIAVVKVKDGVASHTHFIDSPYRHVLDELLDRMKTFTEHLPDMQIPVNLNERSRVLAPWDDVQRYTQAGRGHGLRKLLSRRAVEPTPATELRNRPDILPKDHISAHSLQQMTALACPPATEGRSGVHWNIRDFCATCARPQSEGVFLKDWEMSHDMCHQPDLARLHGFYLTPPQHQPLQQLVPIFSRAKTSSYNDILIPLRRRYDVPEDEPGSDFQMKYDQLFWRGKVDGSTITHDLLHGGHQERLVHLVNNSTSSAEASILLPTPNVKEQHKGKDREDKKDRYRYELAPVSDLTSALKINVGTASYANCKDDSLSAACRQALREFGPPKPEDPPMLKNRYVLLTDSDDGPPVMLRSALRSTSVPFVASVFREWYTERLMPWVHFVPVDVRYQGLFSTFAYFTGLKEKGNVNGRDPKLEPRIEEARWIAEQGAAWAGKAIRREDEEVYLFRVLLEYARLLDDKRDEIGFVLT
ncbi:glycosyltransferase family 90 protein [Coniochaeta sp. 2T2.1]|nr:glycosyltransferase family 90 protein [Coniochaeta sp. 2T2.1]